MKASSAKPHEFEIRTIQPKDTHGRAYVVDDDITVPVFSRSYPAPGNSS